MTDSKSKEIDYFGEVVKLFGPYLTHNKTRKTIRIQFKNGKIKSMLNARLLLELKLSRKLNYNETVDHIDGNPLNDDINNLQLLSRRDNIRKSLLKPIVYIDFICPICDNPFKRKEGDIIRNQRHRKCSGPYCSKSCAAIGGSQK